MRADRRSDAERRTQRDVFGSEADRYDRVRPTYPSGVFDAIAAYGRLGDGTRVIEVGPGTGQATVSMVERGWRIDAIEIDAEMAAAVERRLGEAVSVTVTAFEELPTPADPYDLAFASSAFHWVDPAVRVQRIADVLRPGGTAAILWTRHVRGGTQAFFDAAQACYARWGGDDPAMLLMREDEISSRTDEFTTSPLFCDVTSHRSTIERAYSTADYLDLVRTYSDTITLPDDRRDGLLGCLGRLLDDDHGGRVVRRTLLDVVLARRAAP